MIAAIVLAASIPSSLIEIEVSGTLEHGGRQVEDANGNPLYDIPALSPGHPFGVAIGDTVTMTARYHDSAFGLEPSQYFSITSFYDDFPRRNSMVKWSLSPIEIEIIDPIDGNYVGRVSRRSWNLLFDEVYYDMQYGFTPQARRRTWDEAWEWAGVLLVPELKLNMRDFPACMMSLPEADCIRPWSLFGVEDLESAEIALRVWTRSGSLQASGQRVWADADVSTFRRRIYPAGDANMDGVFDQLDIVRMLHYGNYGWGIHRPSGWTTGDFNNDLVFDQFDIIEALPNYQNSPQPPAAPEPTTILLASSGFAALLVFHRRRQFTS